MWSMILYLKHYLVESKNVHNQKENNLKTKDIIELGPKIFKKYSNIKSYFLFFALDQSLVKKLLSISDPKFYEFHDINFFCCLLQKVKLWLSLFIYDKKECFLLVQANFGIYD